MTDFLILVAFAVFFSLERPRWLSRWMGLIMVAYVLVFLALDVFARNVVDVLVDLLVLALVLAVIEVTRQRTIRKATVTAYRRFFFGEEPSE